MGKSESANWIKNSDIMLDIVIMFIEKIIPNENLGTAVVSLLGRQTGRGPSFSFLS